MLTVWKTAAFEEAGFPTAADHMCPLAKGHYFWFSCNAIWKQVWRSSGRPACQLDLLL